MCVLPRWSLCCACCDGRATAPCPVASGCALESCVACATGVSWQQAMTCGRRSCEPCHCRRSTCVQCATVDAPLAETTGEQQCMPSASGCLAVDWHAAFVIDTLRQKLWKACSTNECMHAKPHAAPASQHSGIPPAPAGACSTGCGKACRSVTAGTAAPPGRRSWASPYGRDICITLAVPAGRAHC